MIGRLLPRNTRFYDYFDSHAKLIVSGADEFRQLVTSPVNIEASASRIKRIEHETDVITHQCVEALHKTRSTPIRRDDIHRLITRMDDIIDFIEAASERIALYAVTDMTPEVRDMADTLCEAAREVEQALKGLRDLETPRAVLDRCIEINRLENQADVILRRAVARLFKEETDAIVVIKWKEIYEHLESAIDRCEDVANIIEGVVLENT